jgi:DNA helicase-2/ATP-dependent DNA helicase PcrA
MSDLLDSLTDAQREAVTHTDGPLLVVAGAGSGKTRVITRRVAYLMARDVPPYRILAITFTNKAADEMKHRVEALSGTSGAWISTFHSMCARMLRQFQDLLGFSHPFSIYDRADSLACVKAAMQELGLAGSGQRPTSFLSAISRAKNVMRGPDDLEAGARHHRDEEAARVYRAYERLCRANNALDFDDLLLQTARLLQDHADFRSYWQGRFHHVLIDEYQDTNRPQYVIAHALTAAHRNLCATGDPDQSIYAWRGADINNILDFQNDYPDVRTVKLEENFRSTELILRAASGVIQNNRERIPRGLWTRQEGGEPLAVVESRTDIDEADAIVAGIRELREAGFAFGDMAVFYRTHAQSRVIEDSLRDAGVPYLILDAVEFYNRKEIKDVVAYLKVLVNPADAVSLLRVINEPRRGIGKRTVERLTAFAASHGISVAEAAAAADDVPGLGPRTANAVREFAALVARLRDLPRSPVAELLRAVLAETGYLTALKTSEADEDRPRAENVSELVNAAAEFDLDYPDAGLEEFLERVTLVSDSDTMTGEGGQVMLMTLHSAKGLEFRAVFIAGVQEGLLPHMNALGSRSRVEEERRLCYVGMTRAKERLALHWASEHFTYGKRGYAVASQFLAEIPEDARTRGGAEAAQRPARKSEGERVIEYDEDVVEYGSGELSEGDRVRHPKFGIGRVVEVFGTGDRTTAVVDFRGRRRHLMLRFVHLVRLG